MPAAQRRHGGRRVSTAPSPLMAPVHAAGAGARPVRRPLLRGQCLIMAVWLPADWLDEAARGRRLLQLWQAGCRAWRFADGDLLQLPHPQAWNSDSAPGWPLQACAGGLCSAPLDAGEIARLPPGDIWLIRAAQVQALFLRDGQPLEPWRWLEPGPAALLDTWDLQAILPAPALELEPRARPLRGILGTAVGPPSAEQLAFLRHLQQQASASLPVSGAGETAVQVHNRRPLLWVPVYLLGLALFMMAVSVALRRPDPARALGYLLLGIAAAFWLWRRWLALGNGLQPAAEDGADGAAGSKLPARQSEPGPERWRDPRPGRFREPRPQRFRAWLQQLLLRTQLQQLLGRQQAAYMQHMLRLFEQGRLDEALRHALPLAGQGPSLGQALGVPSPRQAPSLSNSSAGLSLPLGESLEQHLRQLYRRAFWQLHAAGRIDEAVFVLAELLQVRQEAVDYLEQHGRLLQAAELALLWDMPAATLVRLHALAGQWPRALQLARRNHAFDVGVLALQERWPEAADTLRRSWAEWLAARGEWLPAVEVLWPLAAARPQAQQWLHMLLEQPGETAAEALLMLALLDAHSRVEQRERWLQLRDEQGCWRSRRALALRALQLSGSHPALGGVLRPLLGALLEDQAAGRLQLTALQLQSLLKLADDALLRADLPRAPLPCPAPLSLSSRHDVLLLDAPAAGAHAILDAVYASEGRYLLAVGEGGAMLLDASGRRLFLFASPAEHLVISDSGEVALALARRDHCWRVSRLDLRRSEQIDLGLLEADAWADSFDGVAWTVARGRCLRLLDTTRGLHSILWQVSELPGQVLACQRNARLEQALVRDAQPEPELWTWYLPQRRLGARSRIALADGTAARAANPTRPARQPLVFNPSGGAASYSLQLGSGGMPVLLWRQADVLREIALPDTWPGQGEPQLNCGLDCLLLQTAHHDQLQLQWLRLDDGRCAASLMWPGSRFAGVRQQEAHWLLFDHEGRLLHLDGARSIVFRFSLL